MQRKFLEDLGLEKETVDKIMAENDALPRDIILTKRKTPSADLVHGVLKWCRRRDLNPHELAFTRT